MEKQLAVILGAGPVGLSSGKIFLDRGMDVRFVTRSGKGGLPGAASVEADARDQDALAKAAAGAKILVHAVGLPYQRWAQDLPAIQSAVLSAAEATGAVAVFVENLYSYSAERMPLSEATPQDPPTRKGSLRKRLTDQWLEAHRAGRVKAVSVRASDYLGPGATRSPNSQFGSRFFPGLEAGKPVAFLGNPDVLHGFTYLPDFARALADVALDPGSWGRVWVCPTMEPSSSRALAGLFAAEFGTSVSVRAWPRWLIRTLGVVDPLVREVDEMLYQFDREFTVDGSAFEARFGWKATDLRTAVKGTWDGHRNTGPAS